jgi:hypothetical protein
MSVHVTLHMTIGSMDVQLGLYEVHARFIYDYSKQEKTRIRLGE